MENTKRCVFGLNGVTGMLIATVLLLTILAVLTYLGINAQRSVANQPYKIVNPSAIQMESKDNTSHIEIIKK